MRKLSPQAPVRRASYIPPAADADQRSSRREALRQERALRRKRAHRKADRKAEPRARPKLGNAVRGLIAAVFAVTLFVATSFPANAFTPDPDRVTTVVGQQAPAAQVFAVGKMVDEPTVTRDSFTATTPEELAQMAASDPAGVVVPNSESPIRWPFTGDIPISDGFGRRISPCSGCSSNHKGLDMTLGGGTPIMAVADGIVRSAEESDVGFGVNVVIDHRVNGERFSSLYAHMQFGSLQVAAGDSIKVGQIIGRVGTTGASTGNHLHLEIWQPGDIPTDPLPWLRARTS